MAPKLVIIAGLLLVVAAISLAESTDLSEESSNGELEVAREKRGIIGWIIASWGDALKYFWDGMNKGVKGLLTGLTHAFLAFFAGCAQGLQLWRIGIYRALNGIVDLAQNLLTLGSIKYSNFWEKEVERAKRDPLRGIIAALGDLLKYMLWGLNIGVKGLITGLLYAIDGWWQGWSNGLQLWRLGFYTAGNGLVDFLQNILVGITGSFLHTNFFGENHV